jgi:hypothetical protein
LSSFQLFSLIFSLFFRQSFFLVINNEYQQVARTRCAMRELITMSRDVTPRKSVAVIAVWTV